jgi:6-phosphogluconolactonase
MKHLRISKKVAGGDNMMEVEILKNVDLVFRKAAALIAAASREAVRARGRFIVAFSGGKTPWKMLRALADEDIAWKDMNVLQVDERVAPNGHPDRNLTHLRECLLGRTPLLPEQIYAMAVEGPDLQSAAKSYAAILEKIGGTPPLIDLVHLGLGSDGHTASLVPGDPVLDISDMDVAVTGLYQNRRRMTLTYPILNRARHILWVVTGNDKAGPLRRLIRGDPSIPAGRVCQERATILADPAAAEQLTIP